MAIKKVKGNGERTMYVFSDADCPFCAKLEQELKTVDNVTIYTFLFPIDSLHPDAARKSRIIWCAADRAEGVGCVLRDRRAAGQQGRLRQPGREDRRARRAVQGERDADASCSSDGSIVPGALPAQRLEAELNNAEAEAKKLAAAKKS